MRFIMKNVDDITVVYDANGNIDFNYYVRKAERLRSQAIANFLGNLFKGVKNSFGQTAVTPQNTKVA